MDGVAATLALAGNGYTDLSTSTPAYKRNMCLSSVSSFLTTPRPQDGGTSSTTRTEPRYDTGLDAGSNAWLVNFHNYDFAEYD